MLGRHQIDFEANLVIVEAKANDSSLSHEVISFSYGHHRRIIKFRQKCRNPLVFIFSNENDLAGSDLLGLHKVMDSHGSKSN